METDVKSILSECGFSFKKQLGQNFITDKNLLSSIVALSGAEEGDTVVEIGCGAGTLTRALAQKVKRVISFEVDKTLAPVLQRTLAGLENVEVVFKDFLKVDMPEFESGLKDYVVVANLPYYVTTPLIMKLIESSEKCKGLCVMVQEEVADRLCAKAGTADYGAITAMVALRAECAVVKRVPRTLFTPRPNVDSAVVKFTFGKGIEVADKALYKKVVHAAFGSRRKTLENNLVNSFGFSRQKAQEILTECRIDLKARGETLTPKQFAELAKIISEYK
ncbi:MAG: 16S rRNA (adenine(1518)-N(6)/adenine(1519)-N(6))-dimethyltransferase RsmA [Clostridia bacterium]|nr:16S rRNA (adenine(1518)-N(6)/adenine(1519)-N(6))-dimethyltransferase RsmA [Clostridia bacterium]